MRTAACETEAEKVIYLSVGESYPIGDGETEDAEIISCEDGRITGLADGTAVFHGTCDTYEIRVSDLYTVETLDMDKEYLPADRYTKKENEELDESLAYLIEEASYRSRAAAVEAVRFLTLRFPYKLQYFYENGRLGSDHLILDGQGRYYHQGLYLSDKEKLVGDTGNSAPWGTMIYEYETDSYSPNGLDCSGFICWALYNAGYDCGDIGAGPSEDVYDLTDLGEAIDIDKVEIQDLKCGDLVGLDGHIGMIIGLNDGKIYIGEAYWVNDLQVRIYSEKEFIEKSEWEYVILMDEYYKRDGNYTSFWDEN